MIRPSKSYPIPVTFRRVAAIADDEQHGSRVWNDVAAVVDDSGIRLRVDSGPMEISADEIVDAAVTGDRLFLLTRADEVYLIECERADDVVQTGLVADHVGRRSQKRTYSGPEARIFRRRLPRPA